MTVRRGEYIEPWFKHLSFINNLDARGFILKKNIIRGCSILFVTIIMCACDESPSSSTMTSSVSDMMIDPNSDMTPDSSTDMTSDSSSDMMNRPSLLWNGCQLEENPPGMIGETALDTEVIVSGLEVPWGLVFLPSGDMLVTERPGRLRLVRDGQLLTTPILEFDVSDPPPLLGLDVLGFEGGLLDVLLHPDFEQNRQFYLFYNMANESGEDISRIERYILADNAESASLDRIIIDQLPAGLHHQGGRMRIGPDGMLYVGIGAYEPMRAQDLNSLAGKLLRMTLEGDVPDDNPMPNSYIYVSGIRNTQGYDWFDREHIMMVDHGPSGLELDMPSLRGFDEVNVVKAGDNLGWPRVWGCDQEAGLISPVLSFTQSVPPTDALIYRHDLISEWTNSFLFTAVGLNQTGRHLHRVVFEENNPYKILSHEIYLDQEYGRLRTIVPDAEGALYVMTSNCDPRGECPPERDKIIRIRPQSP